MHFGETTQRARVRHHCDRCNHQIMEGDVYERTVWMPAPDVVCVLRSHIDPDCPEPENYEDRQTEAEEPFRQAA